MKRYKYRKRFTYHGRQYNILADSLVELGQKYAEKLNELKTGPSISGSDTRFSYWADQCIDTYKTGQKAITKKKYKNRVKCCITDQIGDRAIGDITPMDLQKVLNLQQGKSKTQINEVYQAMRFLFRHAVENHLVAQDPTVFLTKPTGTHIPRRALTSTEREAVLEVGKTDRRYYLYLLMLLCGCRPSEAAECKGSDIMTVNKCHMLHVRGTKTAFSDRLVPLPDSLYKLIKRTPKTAYIACTRDGNKITNYDRLWHSFKRQLNIYLGCEMYRNHLVPPYPLAPDLVPYCFRHEYCSDLARKGIDIRTAQKLMGHSDITLTANIYTHVDQNSLLEAAEKLK